MSIIKRGLALLLCATLFPVGASAEEYVIPAGEVTSIAFEDAYYGGLQINCHASFSLEETDSARADALDALLRRTRLDLSFYDDFGTARIRGTIMLDDLTLLSGDALIYEDGSAKVRTSLTGDYVIVLPTGTITQAGIDLTGLLYDESQYIDINDPDFDSLPVYRRLRITVDDLMTTLLSHLLGWVSYTQRDTGELYLFDDTYLEATADRDAVAQRMLATAHSWDFCGLLRNIMWTIRDERGQLQQAIADTLAELGVTRYQVRQVIDGLFTEEKMDPSLDWVQPSESVYDDGALCTMDDIAYAVKKMTKSVERMLDLTNDAELVMNISYGDYGDLVGIDLDVPVFTEAVPYTGFLRYSVKTDEYEQRTHTARGALELFDGKRLVGQMKAKQGEDVDGVKDSGLSGTIELLDLNDPNATIGLGVDAGLSYQTGGEDDMEVFGVRTAVNLLRNSVTTNTLSLDISGATSVFEDGFLLTARAQGNLFDRARLLSDISAQTVEYDEQEFEDGQELDPTIDEQRETIRSEMINQILKLYLRVTANSEVFDEIMIVLGE